MTKKIILAASALALTIGLFAFSMQGPQKAKAQPCTEQCTPDCCEPDDCGPEGCKPSCE